MSLGTRGNTGLKIIVFMGIGTFLFLMLVSYGLRQSFKPQERLRVAAGASKSPFEASRAMNDLAYLAELGPRPSGSSAMESQQNYVLRTLRNAGLQTRSFTSGGDGSPDTARKSIAGVVSGSRPGVLVLAGSLDTHPDSPGANDGGSATAWLLEMARVMGPRRDGRGVWLVFLDGHIVEGMDGDQLDADRAWVEALRASGELGNVETVIRLGMIGDCYLSIFKDSQAPAWLEDIVWNTALRQGYGGHFGNQTTGAIDPAIAFRDAGIPSLSLVDFSYGASRLDHGKNWHTPNDTIEKVCPDSLRAVGDVIYHALPAIEGHLDTMSARSDGH